MRRLEKEKYKHLRINATTFVRKKMRKDTAVKINRGGTKFEKEKKVLDRVEVNGILYWCFIFFFIIDDVIC